MVEKDPAANTMSCSRIGGSREDRHTYFQNDNNVYLSMIVQCDLGFHCPLEKFVSASSRLAERILELQLLYRYNNIIQFLLNFTDDMNASQEAEAKKWYKDNLDTSKIRFHRGVLQTIGDLIDAEEKSIEQSAENICNELYDPANKEHYSKHSTKEKYEKIFQIEKECFTLEAYRKLLSEKIIPFVREAIRKNPNSSTNSRPALSHSKADQHQVEFALEMTKGAFEVKKYATLFLGARKNLLSLLNENSHITVANGASMSRLFFTKLEIDAVLPKYKERRVYFLDMEKTGLKTYLLNEGGKLEEDKSLASLLAIDELNELLSIRIIEGILTLLAVVNLALAMKELRKERDLMKIIGVAKNTIPLIGSGLNEIGKRYARKYGEHAEITTRMGDRAKILGRMGLTLSSLTTGYEGLTYLAKGNPGAAMCSAIEFTGMVVTEANVFLGIAISLVGTILKHFLKDTDLESWTKNSPMSKDRLLSGEPTFQPTSQLVSKSTYEEYKVQYLEFVVDSFNALKKIVFFIKASSNWLEKYHLFLALMKRYHEEGQGIKFIHFGNYNYYDEPRLKNFISHGEKVYDETDRAFLDWEDFQKTTLTVQFFTKSQNANTITGSSDINSPLKNDLQQIGIPWQEEKRGGGYLSFRIPSPDYTDIEAKIEKMEKEDPDEEFDDKAYGYLVKKLPDSAFPYTSDGRRPEYL